MMARVRMVEKRDEWTVLTLLLKSSPDVRDEEGKKCQRRSRRRYKSASGVFAEERDARTGSVRKE